MAGSAGVGGKNKVAEPYAAAAGAASARGELRSRRRRRAGMRGHADEFMDMNVDVEPDWAESPGGSLTAVSDSGAGSLGFSGTARGSEQATGLATLIDDGFGSGPRMPMLPNTWPAECRP
jgi:PPE-repeat protein